MVFGTLRFTFPRTRPDFVLEFESSTMTLENVIKTLRELNEPVPRPFPLPTETEVAAAEKTIGIPFPDDYRHFLLHASDVTYGAIEPAVVVPHSGHLDLVGMAKTAHEIGLSEEFLPFCEDNGDYYCFDPEGHVALWREEEGFAKERWSDLAQWIQKVWLDED